jgi:hypothetical protein
LLTTYLRIQKLEGPFLLAVLFGDSSCHTANTALFDGSLLLLLDTCNTNNLATGKLLTSATQSSRTGAMRISLRDDVSAQSPIIVHLHQCTPPLTLNTTNVGIVAADFERAMCKLMQLAQACLWVLDLHSDANGVSIVASVDSVRVNMSVSAVLSLVEECLQPGGSLLGFGIQRLYIDAREIVIDDPPFFLDATFGMIDVQQPAMSLQGFSSGTVVSSSSVCTAEGRSMCNSSFNECTALIHNRAADDALCVKSGVCEDMINCVDTVRCEDDQRSLRLPRSVARKCRRIRNQ